MEKFTKEFSQTGFLASKKLIIIKNLLRQVLTKDLAEVILDYLNKFKDDQEDEELKRKTIDLLRPIHTFGNLLKHETRSVFSENNIPKFVDLEDFVKLMNGEIIDVINPLNTEKQKTDASLSIEQIEKIDGYITIFTQFTEKYNLPKLDADPQRNFWEFVTLQNKYDEAPLTWYLLELKKRNIKLNFEDMNKINQDRL